MAIVVGGGIVSAPAVQEPITGGEFQITGSFDEQAARQLFHQLTG